MDSQDLPDRLAGRRRSVRPDRIHPAELTTAELARIEELMRPDRSSTLGFLTTEQSLLAVVEQDTATLGRLGVTHERIANRLACLIDEWNMLCMSSQQARELVLGRFWIRGVLYLGYQWCPFEKQSIAPSVPATLCEGCNSEFEVTNGATGESVSFTGLHPHLIGYHAFFEGGPYRLDPERAVRVLELRPDVDDRIARVTSTRSEWVYGARSPEWNGPLWHSADNQRLRKVGRLHKLGPGLTAFVENDVGFLSARKPVSHSRALDLDGSSLHVSDFVGGAELLRTRVHLEHWDRAQIERLTRLHALPGEAGAEPR